jgi:hypothetical protein
MDLRRPHNEKPHNLHTSLNIITMTRSRRMRWARHAARVGETRNEHKILVGETERKRQRGRTRCKWEDNIRMDLREKGWEGMDWIQLIK